MDRATITPMAKQQIGRESDAVRKAVDKSGGVIEVAYKIGVSTSTVYKWIGANEVFLTKHAIKLADLAGVDINELAG